MKKITYFYVYVYLLIIEKKKVLGTRACQTRVPYYKISSLVSLSTIEEKKKEHYARVLYLQRTRAC